MSAPAALSAPASRAPASVTGAKATSGPGLEMIGVSGVTRPRKPMRQPSRSAVHVAAVPGKPSPSATLTLPASQRVSDSASRACSTSGPKSNSWLPRTATSKPTALARSIMCAPLSIPDSTEGEIMSPPKVTMACPPSASARRALLRNHGGDPRGAACIAAAGHLVPVVHVHEGEGERRGAGVRRGGAERDEQRHGGCRSAGNDLQATKCSHGSSRRPRRRTRRRGWPSAFRPCHGCVE